MSAGVRFPLSLSPFTEIIHPAILLYEYSPKPLFGCVLPSFFSFDGAEYDVV